MRYFYSLLLLVLSIHAEASIFTVSNNPGDIVMFNDLNAAMAAASDTQPDTILFYPSGISYGDFTITKNIIMVSTTSGGARFGVLSFGPNISN
jgi:hypothetical protein